MSGFDEVRLPIEVERGARGGPGFLTTITTLASGKERRNSLWSRDRGQWDIGFGIDTRENALRVRDFFMARQGKARGFRFRDWSNYRTEPGVGQGLTDPLDSNFTEYQLTYTYVDLGGFTYTKPITKPVAGTIEFLENGSPYGPGGSVDPETGLISLNGLPDPGSTFSWTGEFDLPVRFDVDQLDIVVENKEVLLTPQIPIVELKL